MLQPVYLFFKLINGAGIIESKLPFRNVCSACKLSSSVFSEPINDSPPTAFKYSHASSSRSEATTPVMQPSSPPCTKCKRHYRNPSRTAEPPQSGRAEPASSRSSDQAAETESYSRAPSAPTNVHGAARNDDCHGSAYFGANPSTETAASDARSDVPPHRHFCGDSWPLKRFAAGRSFDEPATATPTAVSVRSNSVSAVGEASAWRCKRCRSCGQPQDAWRVRSVSTSSRASSCASESRMRLKSDPNLKTSLPRIQSHHSSSDEEWFEEVGQRREEKAAGSRGDAVEIEECPDVAGDRAAEPLAERPDKRVRKRYFLFCIPTKWWGSRHAEKVAPSPKNKTYFRILSSKNRRCRLCCMV